MERFEQIVSNLREERQLIVANSSHKKKRKAAKNPKQQKKLTFDSPELEAIFNSMPDDCKDLIRYGK